MSKLVKKEDEKVDNNDVAKGAEYAQMVRVMLSVYDDLVERGFSKADAIETSKETYNSFLMYKANVESPFMVDSIDDH